MHGWVFKGTNPSAFKAFALEPFRRIPKNEGVSPRIWQTKPLGTNPSAFKAFALEPFRRIPKNEGVSPRIWQTKPRKSKS